jgi:hypothetical protein
VAYVFNISALFLIAALAVAAVVAASRLLHGR